MGVSRTIYLAKNYQILQKLDESICYKFCVDHFRRNLLHDGLKIRAIEVLKTVRKQWFESFYRNSLHTCLQILKFKQQLVDKFWSKILHWHFYR